MITAKQSSSIIPFRSASAHQGPPYFEGTGGFGDMTAVVRAAEQAVGITPDAQASPQGGALPKPSKRPVALSSNMTYQERLDYALAGYQALWPYIRRAAPFGAGVVQEVNTAVNAYYNAASYIVMWQGENADKQLSALQAADQLAAVAITAVRGAASAAPSATSSQVLKTLPADGATDAAALYNAHHGLSTVSKVAIGVLVTALVGYGAWRAYVYYEDKKAMAPTRPRTRTRARSRTRSNSRTRTA